MTGVNSPGLPTLLKTLAPKVSGLAWKNMIVFALRPTHIVRGFLFERTSKSEVFYVWRMVVPMFNKLQSMTLNYSQRLTFGEKHDARVHISEGEYIHVGAMLEERMKAEFDSYLSRLQTPSDFLDLLPFESSDKKRPNVVLDYAIAFCLADRERLGRSLLLQLAELQADTEMAKIVQTYAKRWLEVVDVRAAFDELVSKHEQENIETYFPILNRDGSHVKPAVGGSGTTFRRSRT
jgi:hypothetical protein